MSEAMRAFLYLERRRGPREIRSMYLHKEENKNFRRGQKIRTPGACRTVPEIIRLISTLIMINEVLVLLRSRWRVWTRLARRQAGALTLLGQ